MSGFGIREVFASGESLPDEARRWREDAFLHQLGRNGSLMLAVNHDDLWLEALQRLLGQPAGISWETLSGLLRAMPAHEARKRLWHASHQWWWATHIHRHRVRTTATFAGALTAFDADPKTRTLERQMNLRLNQLDELAWCLQDTEDGIIELADSYRRGARAHP